MLSLQIVLALALITLSLGADFNSTAATKKRMVGYLEDWQSTF
jgi:hypothetical protein